MRFQSRNLPRASGICRLTRSSDCWQEAPVPRCLLEGGHNFFAKWAFPWCCLSVLMTWQLVFRKVSDPTRKARRKAHCLFWPCPQKSHIVTLTYWKRVTSGIKLHLSLEQFMDRPHITGSHKRTLKVPLYLRFSNCIHESVNKGQTLKGHVVESSHSRSCPLGPL